MIFPYEKADMVKIIKDLSTHFLTLYSIAGKDYIQIINWDKHQKPHHTEKDSVIPEAQTGGMGMEKGMEKGMGMENQLKASLTLDNGDVTVISKKAIKSNSFVPPTESEMIDYFKSKGFPESLAKHVFEYYSNGNPPWSDAKGAPVKSWKQKSIAVWFKEENRNWGKNGFRKNEQPAPEPEPATIESLAAMANRRG